MRLLQHTIETLPAGVHFDDDVKGFGVRVGKKRRVYFVRLRDADGTRPMIELGSAIAPDKVSLKDARDAARCKLGQRRNGEQVVKPTLVDSVLAVAETIAHAETMTIGAVSQLRLDAKADEWAKTYVANQKHWHNNVFMPAFGHRPANGADALTREELGAFLLAYKRRAPINANRLHAFVSGLFKWAKRQHYITTNPMIDVGMPTPTKVEKQRARVRVLSPDEIRHVWASLDAIDANADASRRDKATADVWRLRLLFGQRELAIRALEWKWIVLDGDKPLIEWPAHAMKNQTRPHVIPLVGLALDVLSRRRLLASPADRFVFGVRDAINEAPGKTRKNPITGLADFVGKDLRRTAATLMGEHEIDEFWIARVLDHKRAGTTQVYNRYAGWREKHHAVDVLDRAFTAILGPTPKPAALPTPSTPKRPGTVVAFAKRA